MKIDEKIQADIAVAMKDRDEHRLTTLQMMKWALKNKVIEKREELTDAEETQLLTTLIKHRGSWWMRLRRTADRSWRRRSGWRSK
ncbi:GatB/YqeY domain-containing protein [Tunturiibacter gelidiferens]|uniref:GatB/YqeY domain-containing protein n=1 Tax=Tunturiibacter gelidiferens TaxID=3069689 RepID=UPI003D9BEB54